MSTPHEQQLLARAKQGDENAFELLIKPYMQKAYNLAYRMTGNKEDAWDMAQEALVRVYQRLGEFRGDSSFQTWVYRIATNVCVDELRKRRRQRFANVSLDEPFAVEDGEMGRQFADMGERPDEYVERQDTNRMVQQALSRLDDEHRTVLVLRQYQEMSYEEIATTLRLPLGTVKSRINRALTALKEIFFSLEQNGMRVVYRGKNARGKLHEVRGR